MRQSTGGKGNHYACQYASHGHISIDACPAATRVHRITAALELRCNEAVTFQDGSNVPNLRTSGFRHKVLRFPFDYEYNYQVNLSGQNWIWITANFDFFGHISFRH